MQFVKLDVIVPSLERGVINLASDNQTVLIVLLALELLIASFIVIAVVLRKFDKKQDKKHTKKQNHKEYDFAIPERDGEES